MNEIVKAILILGLTLIGSGFIVSFFDYLKTKVELSPTTKESIEIIEKIIESSVIYINQTFVNKLKEIDDFDNKAKADAFSMTKKLVKEQLTENMIKIIHSVYGDMDTYINTMIETYVSKNKMPMTIVENEDIKEEYAYTELTNNSSDTDFIIDNE